MLLSNSPRPPGGALPCMRPPDLEMGTVLALVAAATSIWVDASEVMEREED